MPGTGLSLVEGHSTGYKAVVRKVGLPNWRVGPSAHIGLANAKFGGDARTAWSGGHGGVSKGIL